jgi:hypothetical protein
MPQKSDGKHISAIILLIAGIKPKKGLRYCRGTSFGYAASYSNPTECESKTPPLAFFRSPTTSAEICAIVASVVMALIVTALVK